MQLSKNKLALSVLFFFLLGSWFFLRGIDPPAVVPETGNESVFSAQRAFKHLGKIAEVPHSAGTPANDKVFDYLMSYCEDLGLDPVEQIGTGLQYYKDKLIAGSAKNLLVRLKGTGAGKTVLIAGHYDSQPNTPGAADNGSAVAAMLETIRLLQEGPPLKNDILFLFSDLEEPGQLGAEMFMHHNGDVGDLGLILNFDARGNTGINFTYENSGANGWLMHEFAKAVRLPMANSMAYEVYRQMPNNSDFTVLKSNGAPGLNTAFFSGYSYYHSMADVPENFDLRSLQHEGDLMFGMARHFGNLDLSIRQKDHVVFFNLLPGRLIIYSGICDNIFLGITLVLFIVFISVGIRKRRLFLRPLLSGIGRLTGAVLLVMLLVWGLQWLVFAVYPYYANYYGSIFYNSNYYLITVIGLVLLAFVLFFGKAFNRGKEESLLAGALVVWILLMIAVKVVLPSAAYILYIPLLGTFVVYIVLFVAGIDYQSGALSYTISCVLMLILPVALWVPFVYILFVIFGLGMTYPSALFASFFIPLLVPWIGRIGAHSRRLLFIAAIMLVIAGLLAGQFTSLYNKRYPLQTQLMYAIDKDGGKALWVATQKHKDAWNGTYLSAGKKASFTEFYPRSGFYVWKSAAPMLQMATCQLSVLHDEIKQDKRYIRVLVTPGVATNSFDLFLPAHAMLDLLAERAIVRKMGNEMISFYAPPAEGVLVTFSCDAGQEARLTLIDRKIGLPETLLRKKLPSNMIYAPGYMSNTTQIKQTIVL
ncbi:M28 family peptidase [[Flexibacter] sp. ATCC 35208]|uniref:M28 family peptidase n=1 Tax=[Flexibacter] sp. ATCC 35208 TaxID=1936242 RepID=UPI0009CCBF44|nr:M28 family peptidase [[Flexibacter] sp. ATCC 35208]OMP77905.1 hypothetical protein BW716_17675 [[Flexibacter] sp. ATCC 35208]